MTTPDPITHACRLLREGAEELKNCHTLGTAPDDWAGEPEAKAVYDEHMAAADALERWADSIGAGGVEPLRGRQCLHQIAEPAGEYPALPEPDTHCWDDDTQKDVWSYSKELVRSIVASERAMRAAQPAPAYKDSTPELSVGDSAFESWYSTYNPAHKSDKQRARDAYAAGMGDHLVIAAPAAVAGQSTIGMLGIIQQYLDAQDVMEIREREVSSEDGSDAEMCFGAMEEFLDWLIKQGWKSAPQPSPAAQAATGVQWQCGQQVSGFTVQAAGRVQQDAARYAIVRRGQHWSVINGIGDPLTGERLDAAVDAVLVALWGKP